jgi:hypothetical protein
MKIIPTLPLRRTRTRTIMIPKVAVLSVRTFSTSWQGKPGLSQSQRENGGGEEIIDSVFCYSKGHILLSQEQGCCNVSVHAPRVGNFLSHRPFSLEFSSGSLLNSILFQFMGRTLGHVSFAAYLRVCYIQESSGMFSSVPWRNWNFIKKRLGRIWLNFHHL